jgi:hypothetical protein
MIARLASDPRNWRPGWREGVAANIATTSDIPKRRKRYARRAWRALFRISLAVVAVAAWLSHLN